MVHWFCSGLELVVLGALLFQDGPKILYWSRVNGPLCIVVWDGPQVLQQFSVSGLCCICGSGWYSGSVMAQS